MIIKKYKDSGLSDALQKGGFRPTKLNCQQNYILQMWIGEDCALTLRNLKDLIEVTFNITIGKSTIAKYIGDFNYSIKRISIQPERRNNESAISSRFNYATRFLQLMSTYRETQFIFVDEFGVNVSMRKRYGRSAIGRRAVLRVSNLRSRNISVCAAMNIEGLLKFVHSDRSYDSAQFKQFLALVSAKLRENGLGEVVFVLDNASIHKTREINEFVSSLGHELLFLTPYSPFLNPIENLFSQWK